MIISASSRGGTEKHIPKHTVGIVFLGTPHRGSASSNWGSLIVQSGKALGLDGEDRILLLLLLVYGLVRSPIWVHEGELMYIGKSPKENP